MAIKSKGEEFRTITVCIDDYKNGVPEGRFYNLSLTEGKAFLGVTQFLLQIEQLLDGMDFPKAFHELRRFASPPEGPEFSPGPPPRPGAAATFSVRILFRQNASWQGSVTWMEGRQEQSFRSALELILLMDNALTYTAAS